MDDRRSWFALDGTLAPLPLAGDASFRFPDQLCEFVITRFSNAADWVFDPFAGFGTTLVVAEALGRSAVGAEVDRARAAFAASRIDDPTRLVQGSCESVAPGRWPPFQLVLTSPPYGSFVDGALIDSPADYVAGAARIFRHISTLLAAGAVVAVEVGQVRDGPVTRPVVWQIGRALSEVFTFHEDIVRINTGDAEASPGYGHSHLLIFRK